eukprot:TRINITY_DN108459_c0_g1_i1.p1 TRINITY_DN108459_c0_g1~~TRINITY_DN108459_c0_g1_i1.p1  ORF type:complete len:457 (-),score=87.57 TRINITY_DN108459_c0_g1_i1:36-1406(-)
MAFMPYKSRVGDTPEERKHHVESSLGIALGEAVGNSAWRRQDDPDKVIVVFYNACQGNYLDTGTQFFCMCVGGSEVPYRSMVQKVTDSSPLRRNCHVLQYSGTNMHRCPALFPDTAAEEVNREEKQLLYIEHEFPGERLLRSDSVKTKKDVLMIFKQLLEFAALTDSYDHVAFDKYHTIPNSMFLKLEDGNTVLKINAKSDFLPVNELVEYRFAQSPHPELWDEAHGGYFQQEKALDPARLQAYSLGMIFARILLGDWLLKASMKLPLFNDWFDFKLQGIKSPQDQKEEEAQTLASDQAFLEFMRSRISLELYPANHFLSRETAEHVLADESFMSDWRSMLQYNAADRPTAAEVLRAAAWIPSIMAVTIHAVPPLHENSLISCTNINGEEVLSRKFRAHSSIASIRIAVAEKLGLQMQEFRLLLPDAKLLPTSDDSKTLLECLQVDFAVQSTVTTC